MADYPPPSALPPRPELPDLLTTREGEPVETAAEWRERRDEIEGLVRHYVYGFAPDPPEIEADVERTDALDGRATLTEATLQFADLGEPAIDLALFTPADRERVPTFLGLNREGNHALVSDDAVSITASGRRFGADARGARADFWCVERLLERGYGFATFHQADVDPDRDAHDDGLHAFYDRSELPGDPAAAWGTLAAWAWGLQRCVDCLADEALVADDGIAVIGHSRRGKAALLAGATDERIDLVVPHQSGTGGCALSRNNGQETVARITESFPHWFDDVFPAFAGRPERLPLDQHFLVSLVAPRPLLDTEGARDYWANPGRALDALEAAAPAWDLLGADGMDAGVLYGDDVPLENAGDLLQYRRETGHTLNRGWWEGILDFADQQL